MYKKAVSGIMLILLLTGLFSLAINVRPVKSTWTGTVYIRADGSIDPPDAPITTYDNITYTLTGNITSSGDGIVIERDNIIIDGAGYTLQGSGAMGCSGIYLSSRSNVTIKNFRITTFDWGIRLYSSSNNSISQNYVSNCSHDGIYLSYSNYNLIAENIFTENEWDGVNFYESSNNIISDNNITNNNDDGIVLWKSSNNNVHENFISQNGGDGIWIDESSNNIISENIVMENYWAGICIQEASNNVISANNLTINQFNIYIVWSSSNWIYHNNFRQSYLQVGFYDSGLC